MLGRALGAESHHRYRHLSGAAQMAEDLDLVDHALPADDTAGADHH